MKANNWLIILLSILSLSCKDSSTVKLKNDNSFYDKVFGWKIEIPKNCVFLDSLEIEDIKKQGKQLSTNPSTAKTSNTILMFKQNDLNAFTANYDHYQNSPDMVEITSRLKDAVLIDRISKIMPSLKMEYSVEKENVSGLEFRKSRITFTNQNKNFLSYITYSRLFNDKLFFAVIMFENEVSGKLIADAFKKSTFKR